MRLAALQPVSAAALAKTDITLKAGRVAGMSRLALNNRAVYDPIGFASKDRPARR